MSDNIIFFMEHTVFFPSDNGVKGEMKFDSSIDKGILENIRKFNPVITGHSCERNPTAIKRMEKLTRYFPDSLFVLSRDDFWKNLTWKDILVDRNTARMKQWRNERGIIIPHRDRWRSTFFVIKWLTWHFAKHGHVLFDGNREKIENKFRNCRIMTSKEFSKYARNLLKENENSQ